jgi:hypothetical protein
MMHILLLSAALGFGDAPTVENPLAKELVTKGLVLPQGPVLLPAPVMPDGLAAAEQTAIIKKLYPNYQLFIRNKDVSPHKLTITPVEGKDKERIGQKVDLYFVAYGKLDSAVSNDVMEQLLGNPKNNIGKGNAAFLSDDQLKMRDITAVKSKGLEERYTILNFELLDKVQLSGVGRAFKTNGATAIVSAMQLDPRFANDKQFPNQWRPVDLKNGKKVIGQPKDYEGFGGYVRMTELKEPAGALFVEFHLVMNEPREWFDGRNLIKAKLPLAIKTRVESFRRQLSKASK